MDNILMAKRLTAIAKDLMSPIIATDGIRKLSPAEVVMVKEDWAERSRGRYRRGIWRSGMRVSWQGHKYFVYDLMAESSAPSGVELILVSPDFTGMVDNVSTEDVVIL